MKILHLSSSDLIGGAGIAAYRLHLGLRNLGANSQMLVQVKRSDDWGVYEWHSNNLWYKLQSRVVPQIDSAPLALLKEFSGVPFSFNVCPNSVLNVIDSHKADIIHLHWVNGSFIPLQVLRKIQQPIVWTLHDMWPITGGCHYDEGCGRYEIGCGLCPQLGGGSLKDLSTWNFARKAKLYRDASIHFVCPSTWLYDCVRASPLATFSQVDLIPYGLDLNVFKPFDKAIARDFLNLPPKAKIVLFGAVNPTADKRKGYQKLLEALNILSGLCNQEGISLAIFGASAPQNPPNFDWPTYYLGRVVDSLTLSTIYSAADVFVLPSLQDNLPNTALESLACGTPVVSFKIGGMPDIINHKVNGYLATAYDSKDLADGIQWTLNLKNSSNIFHSSRNKAISCYGVKKQAEGYFYLYKKILMKQNEDKLIGI